MNQDRKMLTYFCTNSIGTYFRQNSNCSYYLMCNILAAKVALYMVMLVLGWSISQQPVSRSITQLLEKMKKKRKIFCREAVGRTV